MKVGDLVKVKECDVQREVIAGRHQIVLCECFFCYHKSNRIGLVVEVVVDASQSSEAPAWWVQFDCGVWEIFPSDLEHGDMEVISESR